MPWQEVSTVSLRQEFITLVQQKSVSVSELCRRYGVSRKTGYKWLGRYQREGPAGLLDRSRLSRTLAGWRCARSTRAGDSISRGAPCGSREPSSGTPWGCSRPRRMGSWTSGSVSIASRSSICADEGSECVTHVSGTSVTLDSGPNTLTKGRQLNGAHTKV
jgi:transposase-like protein